MLRVPLKKRDFYETHIAHRLTVIHSTCSSNLQPELLVTHANTPTAPSRFKKGIFQHNYAIHKNSSSIETEQRYLCRVLHFNRSSLMLISPPNDEASVCQLLLTYGLLYKNVGTSGLHPTK